MRTAIAIALLACIGWAGMPYTAEAQQADAVHFRFYGGTERQLLDSLHRLPPEFFMPDIHHLRRQALTVKESTPVPVALRKPVKRQRAASRWIADRRESVLKVCHYRMREDGHEDVSLNATAIVLTADGICLTNYHVFNTMLSLQQSELPATSKLLFVADQQGHAYRIDSLLAYNQLGDIAIFRIDTRGHRLIPMPVGQDQPVAANVHTLTNPERFTDYYSRGVVARNWCALPNDPFTRRTDITADYAKGSSGGPIFDDRGNLVALVSSTQGIYYQDNPPSGQQMVVKSTIPVSTLRRLVLAR